MSKSRVLWSAIFAAALIAGCGKGDDKKPATQVAAKVNGDEISVHQINTALMQSGATTGDPKDAGRQVLERLIDQQLLVQKAVDAKLDRDPNVLTAIENSRRQILAQAYIERTLSESAMPTSDEIKKYYADHPEIFGKRRLYRFQEVLAAVENEGQMKELQAQLAKTHNMGDVTSWLREKNVKYNMSFSMKASEQLPRNLLPKLANMKQGDVMFYPAGNRALIVQLTGWQELPMSEAEAAPYIAQALLTQKRGEQANEELKRLRTTAKVEYVGEYAKSVAATQPEDQHAAKSAPAKPADTAKKDDASAIDKGLTGLK
jgi:EpsD family peptidyl-prolyl cis-trans isomerase